MADVVGDSPLLAADCALRWHRSLQKAGYLYHLPMSLASDPPPRGTPVRARIALAVALFAVAASAAGVGAGGCRRHSARERGAVGRASAGDEMAPVALTVE